MKNPRCDWVSILTVLKTPREIRLRCQDPWAWRIHSRFYSCTSSHVGVHLPLSLLGTDEDILAALTDETFDISSGAKDKAAEEKGYTEKKCFRTAVLVPFPLLSWENLLRMARHKLGIGVAILTQIHTALLTVLVVWDKTTHPDWNYSLQLGLQMWSEEKWGWMLQRRGGERCYPNSNIQYHRLCMCLQPFCCVNVLHKSMQKCTFAVERGLLSVKSILGKYQRYCWGFVVQREA